MAEKNADTITPISNQSSNPVAPVQDHPPATSGEPTTTTTTATEPEPTVRKTPFSAPAASTVIPATAEPTAEQETKYTALLETVRTWPSTQTPTEHEQAWLTRDCLLRYLRASSWNTSTAQQRLEATLAWRRSYGVDSKLTAAYISPENETGKQWILGYDKAGRPCLYLNPSRQNTPRSDRQIEHLVFMLERCVDLAPAGQESMALLINFAETRNGQGASIAQGRQTLSILQNHYPERLGRALLTNLPWHISGFMRLILPFVDPVTRAKVVINQPMPEQVPADQLPPSHGGTLNFEYDHAVYWPELDRLATQRRESQFERWVKGGKHIGESEMYLKGGTEKGVAAAAEAANGAANGVADTNIETLQGLTITDETAKPILDTEVEREGEVFRDAPEDIGSLGGNGKV